MPGLDRATRASAGLLAPPIRRGFRTVRRWAQGAFVLLLLAPASLAGQEEPGGIRGTVVDVRREAPVGMAEVDLPALERRTVADAEGRFRFRDVPPGSYRIRVRFLGYEATAREVEVEAGATRSVEVRVAPGPVEVEDLAVTVRSLTWVPGFRERREDRTGHFFTKREIEAAGPDRLTQLLRDHEGLRIGFNREAHGHSKRYPQFYYRGPGRGIFCRPPVFVDGEMIGPGREYWYFNEIPPERVLAMEVYYRERDVPETLDYDLGVVPPEPGRDGLGELEEPGRRRGVGATRDGRRIVTAAGLDDVFDRRTPRRDEDLDLDRTVLAGLYERLPEFEHCGAIFVWTRLYLQPGG